MQFASLADLVKHFESSGGDYQAVNPSSGAGGAYQFLPSTWRGYAGQIGVDTSIYPTAQSAPPGVQDAVFQQAVNQNGLGDWTCSNCNAPLTSYVGANPSALGLPVLSGGASLPGGGASAPLPPDPADPFTAGDPTATSPGQFLIPGTNTPVTPGGYDFTDPSIPPLVPPGTDPSPSSPWSAQPYTQGGGLSQIYQAALAYLTRGGLIFLGVLLIVVAAWAAAEGEFGGGAAKLVKAAA